MVAKGSEAYAHLSALASTDSVIHVILHPTTPSSVARNQGLVFFISYIENMVQGLIA